MTKAMTIDEVFGEDVYVDEMLNEIRFEAEDVEGATLLEDKLSYNEGWYNYSEMKFDYNGNRYSIEYKEHTSDNVSDMEWLADTFIFLGETAKMSKKVNAEDVARMKHSYQRQIERLEAEVRNLRQYRDIVKEAPKKTMKDVGEILMTTSEKEEVDVQGAKNFIKVGEAMTKLSNLL